MLLHDMVVPCLKMSVFLYDFQGMCGSKLCAQQCSSRPKYREGIHL